MILTNLWSPSAYSPSGAEEEEEEEELISDRSLSGEAGGGTTATGWAM